MNIVDKIVSANYQVTIDQVEELARQHTIAINRLDTTGSTYGAALMARLQVNVESSDDNKEVLVKLDSLHKAYYAAVRKGVAATGARGPELNSKSNFASSFKSELVGYFERGGDIRDLVPGKTSKGDLRAFGRSEVKVDLVEKAGDSIIKRIKHIAKTDIDEARRDLQFLIDKLIKALTKLDEEDQEAEVTNHNLERSEYRHNA